MAQHKKGIAFSLIKKAAVQVLLLIQLCFPLALQAFIDLQFYFATPSSFQMYLTGIKALLLVMALGQTLHFVLHFALRDFRFAWPPRLGQKFLLLNAVLNILLFCVLLFYYNLNMGLIALAGLSVYLLWGRVKSQGLLASTMPRTLVGSAVALIDIGRFVFAYYLLRLSVIEGEITLGMLYAVLYMLIQLNFPIHWLMTMARKKKMSSTSPDDDVL